MTIIIIIIIVRWYNYYYILSQFADVPHALGASYIQAHQSIELVFCQSFEELMLLDYHSRCKKYSMTDSLAVIQTMCIIIQHKQIEFPNLIPVYILGANQAVDSLIGVATI